MIDFIGKNKFRLSRGYTYISMFAMPLLVVDVIERRFPEVPFVGLFIFGIIGIWIMGYIDDKLGVLNGEQSYSVSRTKILMDGLYHKKGVKNNE